MHARVFIVVCVLLTTANVAQSKRWFASEVNCWITQEKVPALWKDAQQRCERDGAVLASPLNTLLYDYLQSRINVHNDSVAYFIGTRTSLSEDGRQVHYVSVEGRRLDDMPMVVFDAVKQIDLKQGDCLSMDRYGIHSVSCWDHLPYFCYSNEEMECGSVPATTKAPTSAPTRTTSTPSSEEPEAPGYTYYPATGSYYKFHNSGMNWYDANATCAGEGAHVVVLNDAEEADVVAGIMRNANYGYQWTWTGLRDYRPGGVMDWRTVLGEPISEVFHEWSDGHPFNDERLTCVYFFVDDERLYDHPCDRTTYVMCEISQ